MVWNRIKGLDACSVMALPEVYPKVFLTLKTEEDKSCWLVGPYRHLTRIATDLRTSEELRELLTEQRVRLGLRKTDLPPASIKRQERYGPAMEGENSGKDFRPLRQKELAIPLTDEQPSMNRESDRKENVKTFWETQTPQSHHIVEFNHLKKLGVSLQQGKGELDYDQLPAVLLAAELHQRYISSYFKVTHDWDKKALAEGISQLYRSLYVQRSQLFHPLWDISKIILEEAELMSDKSLASVKSRSRWAGFHGPVRGGSRTPGPTGA